MTKGKKPNKGFTLLEVVISITLMSILLVVLFRSFTAIQNTASKIDERRGVEKEIYLFYNYMNGLCKSISAKKVFNNISTKQYFQGKKDEFTFMTTSPIIFPYRIPHLINIKFEENQVLYKEQIYIETAKEPVQFEFNDEEPEVLLASAEEHKIYYRVWDELKKEDVWKEEINTFERDPLPNMIHIQFTTDEKVYQFEFKGVVREKQK